jgi:hypothetical protein
VAHPIDDPDIILGFLVFEGTKEDPIIHFIFVKRAFRNMGVGGSLLRGLDLSRAFFTHFTRDVDWILKKYPSMKYDPYAL